MDKYKRIPLRTFKHKKIYYNQIVITDYLKKIEKLLEESSNLNNIEFSKRVLNTASRIELTKNSYEAYDYILKNKEINRESLKKLYKIISRDELKKEELKVLGKYYRTSDEFMINKVNNTQKRVGASPKEVESYMDKLIEYINIKDNADDFIKSQIIHLYFVYIHPYPNINGRTSRTLASWYLIEKQKYPHILFSRASSFHSINYSKAISSIYHHGNITPFLIFMLKETEKEIKIIKTIEKIASISNIDIDELKLLEYLLTVKKTNIESLSRMNYIHNRYIPTTEIEEKIKQLSSLKILIENNNEFFINKKLIKNK